LLFFADGAGHVPNDCGVVVARLVLDGGEGAEEQAGGVGDDGGATGGDAVLGEEDQELGENLVDVGGRGELGKLADQLGPEVDGVGGWGLEMKVTLAEVGGGVGESETTAAPARVAMEAPSETLRLFGRAQGKARTVARGVGVSGFFGHESLFGEDRKDPPPG
jgi:hypothetical protein